MLLRCLTQRAANQHCQFDFMVNRTQPLRQRQRLADIAERRFRLDKQHRLFWHGTAHFLNVLRVVAADADHFAHGIIQ
ncbi:hypothetical protein D3C76_1370990 [compost metagenome]